MLFFFEKLCFFLLKECEPGLGAKAGYLCETCPPTEQNVLRMLGVLVAVSVVIVVFIYQTIKAAEAEKSDLSTIGKIFFSYLQFVK